jgi:type II secretory pathway component PulF
MPTFTYEAREQSGKVERGTRDAESAEAVARELRAQGYFVVTVERVARPRPEQLEQLKRQVLAPVLYPVSSKHRAMFYSSLKALMSSGMNVSEAMGSLAKRTQNHTLKAAAAEMAEEAIRGRPMSGVMRKYPAAFPAVALAVMEAGEESGLIELTADRLAKYYDRAFELEQMYRWQTFYPKILVIALIVIPTVPVLVMGTFAQWISLVLSRSLPLLLAALALWYGGRLLLRVPQIKRAFDSIKLAIPWFGSLSRRMSTARWARALAMLLSAGVPVHRAMVAAASATGNGAMEEALVREAAGVLHGKTVAEAVTASRHIPEMALDMLATAERAGSIEDALEKVADYYESETDVGGKQTAVALGVVLYLLVALAIGIFVISFWKGYFGQFTELLGGGGP